MTRAVLAAACLAAATGCVAQAQPVAMTSAWPDETRAYDDVVRDWSQNASLVEYFDKVIEVTATFKSPEWRAAWVEYQATRQKLPDGERAALLDQEKRDDAAHYELLLIVSTYEGRENDLQKGDKSIWRVALIDGNGSQVTPTSIKRDRRPAKVIRALHPGMNDFAEVYVVKFPRTIDVLGGKQFSLRVSGPRGAVELVWRGR